MRTSGCSEVGFPGALDDISGGRGACWRRRLRSLEIRRTLSGPPRKPRTAPGGEGASWAVELPPAYVASRSLTGIIAETGDGRKFIRCCRGRQAEVAEPAASKGRWGECRTCAIGGVR